MPRLGELLTSLRLIEPDKLEQALRAQVVWGGRLGTNLIELGCIDLDGLSRALGRQHSLPAALARHFEKADPALQARLPADIARQFSIVPLLQVGSDRKVAVATLDPLPAEALVALADVYGRPESGFVVSVAAEMRVRYHLERAYKIARSSRYLRAKGKTITPFPQFDDFEIETDTQSSPAVVVTALAAAAVTKPISDKPTGRASVPPPPVNADDLAALIDAAIETASAPPPIKDEPSGRERRTYVKTLGESDEGPTPTSPIPVTDGSTDAAYALVTAAANAAAEADVDIDIDVDDELAIDIDDGSEAASSHTDAPSGLPRTPLGAPALGRMSLKRVAIATPADGVPESPGARASRANSLLEATKAIRRGPNRDRVAELAMDALNRFVPACQAALLLVIRGEAAIGWKHFCRDGAATSDLAVPLDQPGMVPRAVMHNMTARARATDLNAIDQLLRQALGKTDGEGELTIVPVSVSGQVMCVLAAATSGEDAVKGVEAVASATGTAFKRLIRDASR